MKFHASTQQSRYQSPLGEMRLAASDLGLVGIWFLDQRHAPDAQLQAANAWPFAPKHPVLVQTAQQLTEYFAAKRRQFDLPLDLSGGTAFQQSVWAALLRIGMGDTSSYLRISQHIGNPKAVRAVGGAVGHNPLTIVVPCHRVLGADGSLTGYAGGLPRKTALLALEGIKLTQSMQLEGME
jgi:methylated-DNA-[protein]-cysteine S-methyltransferase